jgi:ribosomal protein S18 acetylase RimI-like enzyme
MWVAPGYRRRGIGQLLVDEIANWARSRHVRSLELMVTSVNDSATRFYERLGFQRTGRTEPYPHNSTVLEYEMSKLIS